MSYLAANVPGMEDLRKSAASIIEFADTTAITIIPVLPSDDCGPEVRLGPAAMDLPAFLALAQKLGGGVLYVRATPFDPAATDDEPVEELPSHLTKREGEVGYLGVAFAVNGLIHFWEQTTAWYQEWQLLLPDDAFGEADEDGPEQLSDEERDRLAAELADILLINPEVRGAKTVDRNRIARLSVPADTDSSVAWEAVRIACDRAQELARVRYAEIMDRLDDLAALLLTNPQYQRASSPGARKQAAEQFLIPHADGFPPPALIRDELYARTQQLAKRASPSQGLF